MLMNIPSLPYFNLYLTTPCSDSIFIFRPHSISPYGVVRSYINLYSEKLFWLIHLNKELYTHF